ncbi:hypothetical protein GCM10010129_55680 [Streptomyces fumigatiscleroticus]|nr:hypothetical protein GCM10010129_55680 [Streptomyces fumigatiscleroticus]
MSGYRGPLAAPVRHPVGKLREVLHKDFGPTGPGQGAGRPFRGLNDLVSMLRRAVRGGCEGVSRRAREEPSVPRSGSSRGIDNGMSRTPVPVRRHDLRHVGGGV